MPHWDLDIRAESVVYIHGIGNQVAAQLLKLDWDRSLYRHDLGDRSAMAYWADIRHPQPLDSNGALAQREEFASGDRDMAVPDEVAAKTPATPRPEDVDDHAGAADFSVSYMRELIVRESTDADNQLWPTDRFAADLFFSDAYAYFFNKQQREAIRDRLRSHLDAALKPVLLVAHSLGSIIAYDVLHEDHFAGLKVAAFITFGSQLGVAAVRDRVRRPLEVPASVQAGWHNYLDVHDLLSMRKLLKQFYQPYVIEDEWADNPSPNNHDAAGYLSETRLQAAAHHAFPWPPEI